MKPIASERAYGCMAVGQLGNSEVRVKRRAAEGGVVGCHARQRIALFGAFLVFYPALPFSVLWRLIVSTDCRGRSRL